MASPFRSEKTSGNNEPPRVNPQQPALAVTPLNSVPYVGPPTARSNIAPTPTKPENAAVGKFGPTMTFHPSDPSREKWDKQVTLTGCAAMEKVGPTIGLMDIGESEDSYLFRVSLPGVIRDEKYFSCDIEPDGKILIKGVTITGEKTVCKHSQIFKMQTQNLCPPGHFTITFQLPGPVDNKNFTGNFGTDGVLEGIVKKR